RKWVTGPREIRTELSGKRIDLLDNEDVWKDIGDGWEETQEGYTDTTFSYRYPVLWASDSDSLSADTEGLEFDEFRMLQAHEVEDI
ncbi:MAG TPA: hypothetical protein VIY48_05005, partial [Candidatus Paceibacterota bacterium]